MKYQNSIDITINAANELIKSQKFTEFLGIILAVANFLDPTRISEGFKLKSLLKLIDTKSADNSTNLLNLCN